MSNDRIEGRIEGDASRRLEVPLGTPDGTPPRGPPLSQAAVAALIEQNYVGLRLLVTRRCHDPNVAADLLNEAVVTTWTKWQAGKIERPEQIAGYVLQVKKKDAPAVKAKRPDVELIPVGYLDLGSPTLRKAK